MSAPQATSVAQQEQELALADVCRAIVRARQLREEASGGAIEGILVMALAVAARAVPGDAVEALHAIELAIATYDDAMYLAMMRRRREQHAAAHAAAARGQA